MPKAATGYYAVAKGFNPGVYGTWDDCESQVKGFPGAKHKKFKTEVEAKQWLTTNGVSAHIVRKAPAPAPAPVPAPTASTSTRAATPTRLVPQKTPRFSPIATNPKGKAKESSRGSLLGKDVIEDTTGWQIVYCDGACRGNGKVGAVAGVGVWWGPDDERNIAERCPGDQTNNRAELIALVRILETTPITSEPLLIRTDSTYSIKCFKEYLPKWRVRGFKTASGSAVKNLGIILYFDALLEQRTTNQQKIHLEYVKGHSGDQGNDGADHQANLGCVLPVTPEPDWAALKAKLQEQTHQPPGDGYKVSQPHTTATVVEPAPVLTQAEVEDMAQYMLDDPTLDLSE